MGFFKSAKGSIISDYFSPLHDIGQIKEGNATDVALYDDHLEMKCVGDKEPVMLNYSQVTDVFYGFQTELIEKNKSVIGRAVAGGLLFGGVGAMVGAVSGNGTKQKKVSKIVFIISYTSSSGDDSFLQFEDTRMYKGKKVANKLKELCGITDHTGPVTL